MELPDLQPWEAQDLIKTARVVQAHRALQEWNAEGMIIWDKGDYWYADPDWIAHFNLSCELSDRAYAIADEIADCPAVFTLSHQLARICNRVGDKYLVG